MKKNDNTLLIVAGGVAAIYLLTRQTQRTETVYTQPPAGGRNWIDLVFEYGDDLINIFKKDKSGGSGLFSGGGSTIPSQFGFPIYIPNNSVGSLPQTPTDSEIISGTINFE